MKLSRFSVLWMLVLSLTLFGCSDDPDPVDVDHNNSPSNNTPGENNTPGDDLNACGGENLLLFDGNAAEPGEACGECGGGVLECDGENALECVGADALNACGGCGVLDDVPGSSCGELGTWVCAEDRTIFCAAVELPEVVIQSPELSTPDEIEEYFEVGTNSAVLKAEFAELPENVVITDHGFCWSEEPGPTQDTAKCESLGPLAETGEISVAVDSLLPGRMYYVRGFVTVRVVLPGALADGTTYYSEEIVVTTLAAEPQGFHAGDEQVQSSTHVGLGWDLIDGAVEYVIYRDGEEIARVSGDVAEFFDEGATVAPAPSVPANVVAAGMDHAVKVSWDASAVEDGPVHQYQVQVIYPARESELSESLEGYRKAEPVSHYEVYVGGAWHNVGLVHAYDDESAPANVIFAPTVSATKGENANHVSLSVLEIPEVSATGVIYQVRAVNASGVSEASHEVSASRTSGALEYQWERSTSTSDADYSALSGATDENFEDVSAPADGSARYYRVRVAAEGAEAVYSDAVVGFRAALANLSTLAASSVETTEATLHGSLSSLGVPHTSAHGFCYGTQDSPSHSSGAICVNLGATSSTGDFSHDVSGLAVGTRYVVRAFATTNAGTAYGNNESFWTVTHAPSVSVSPRGGNITVYWDAVQGAAQYIVKRDGEIESTLSQSALSYLDSQANQPPAPSMPVITSITDGTRTDGVLIEWEAPSVSAGTQHVYEVISVNADGLESAPGTASGRIAARPVTGYQIKIGDEDWLSVGDASVLSYLDEDAPRGEISAEPIAATQGQTITHVALTSLATEVSTPLEQSYQVRAVNASGPGIISEAVGRRQALTNFSYQWYYSADGTEGSFLELSGANTDAFNDISAPVDGSDRFYYVSIIADGAEEYISEVVSGFRAAVATTTLSAVSDVEKTTVTLNGNLIATGRPTAHQHGFCYGLNPEPDLDNDTCTQLGMIDAPGSFSSEISGLSAGTHYAVRAYTINGEDGIAYSEEAWFWTKTEAPQNVSASSDQHEHVVVSWPGVTGAHTYAIYRNGVLLEDAVQDLEYIDTTAQAAPVASAPEGFEATQGVFTDKVVVSWDAATVKAGLEYDYHIVAINEDGVQSEDSLTVQGERAARGVTSYKIKVGDGAWKDIGDVLVYDDTHAPKGKFTTQGLSASQGSTKAYVALNITVDGVIPPAAQSYQIRAINPVGEGEETASFSGHRVAGNVYQYQWYYSDDATADADVFLVLNDAESTTFNDEGAPLNGDARRYLVRISGEGIETFESSIIEGFKAVDPTVSVQTASAVEMTTATLHGTVVSMGKPDIFEYGFCYGTNPAPEHDALDTQCEAVQDSFELEITELNAGTRYYVRSYAINNNDGAVYSETTEDFWTRTKAPKNLVATGEKNAIKLSWDAVDGATKYEVWRQGSLDDEPVFVNHVVVTLDSPEFVDDTVSGGVPEAVDLLATAHVDFVRLEWEAPGASDGEEYTYVVLALNEDNLESAFSSPDTARALGGDISGYELEIDAGEWVAINAQDIIEEQGSLSFEDIEAPAPTLLAGSITATNGTIVGAVHLVETPPDSGGQDGATRNYRVRAVNLDANDDAQSGTASQTATAHRLFDAATVVSTAWQRKELGAASETYVTIDLECAPTCADESAEQHVYYTYRLGYSAPEFDTVYSNEADGTLADVSVSYVTDLTDAEFRAGQEFDVIVQLNNQFDEPLPFSGIEVEIQPVPGVTALASTTTDLAGAASFTGLSIVEVGSYQLRVTSENEIFEADYEELSATFDIIADVAGAEFSSITGESGKDADGEDVSQITIILRDKYQNPIVDVTPSFEASGPGNILGSCSQTTSNGEALCTMRSSRSGEKILSIVGPQEVVKDPMEGDTIHFDLVCEGSAFNEGDGSLEDPYTVCNGEQLNTIGANFNNSHFIQKADIVLPTDTNFNMIGGATSATAFSGGYNGNGYSISNLTIAADDLSYVGMFRSTNNALLKNIRLVDVDVSGKDYVGALVGYQEDTSVTVSDAHGKVVGSEYVGGLVGYLIAESSITTSSATVTVDADNAVGGLVGLNLGGTIEDSYANGDVVGLEHVGGLVGLQESGNITTSYATGEMSGNDYFGGLVGERAGGSIVKSYRLVGAVVSCDTNCDLEYDGLTELTALEMELEESFAEWDFDTTWQMVCARPRLQWQKLTPEVVCPCDPDEPDFTLGHGTGTTANPYQICSGEQLNNIGANFNSSHFIQMADIVLQADTNFNMIGGTGESTAFAGSYDGNGHTISNLRRNSSNTNNIGMFRRTNNATLTRIRLVDVDITGSNYTGGLVGQMGNSSITSSYVTGSVDGGLHTGGLVGIMYDSSITSSYAVGTVHNRSNYVGGLVGSMLSSSITASYTSVNVSSGSTLSYAGGIAGISTGSISITSSYATGELNGRSFVGRIGGRIATPVDTYWNSDADFSCSGICNNNGTGLSWEQMTSQDATYFEGFDFEHDWKWIGCGPPRLMWEDVDASVCEL